MPSIRHSRPYGHPCGWLAVLGAAFWCIACAPAVAKESHYEQVRVALMARAALCTTCHVPEASSETGAAAALNDYGQRLADRPKGDSLARRMAELERDVRDKEEGKSQQRERDRDVDGDGVPNWIEILAGASPADAEDAPTAKMRQRIERVVSCRICHEQVHVPGKSGRAANPHNPLGKLLAKTYILPEGAGKPRSGEDVRQAAERTPILARLVKARTAKPAKSRATFWQRLRLLRSTVDAADSPSAEELAAFKKQAAKQRSKRKRDPALGLKSESHAYDGFLSDGDALD